MATPPQDRAPPPQHEDRANQLVPVSVFVSDFCWRIFASRPKIVEAIGGEGSGGECSGAMLEIVMIYNMVYTCDSSVTLGVQTR